MMFGGRMTEFSRRRRRAAAALVLFSTLVGAVAPARAQFFFPFFFDNRPTAHPAPGPAPQAKPRPHPRPKPRAAEKKPSLDRAEAKPTAPAPLVDTPPPYQAQLLRLAEIMGGLAVLQPLCGGAPDPLRSQMEALMAAENAGPAQRERLAGAYNRGFEGWRAFYRDCTANARVAQARFTQEGAQIAHDISARYRAN